MTKNLAFLHRFHLRLEYSFLSLLVKPLSWTRRLVSCMPWGGAGLLLFVFGESQQLFAQTFDRLQTSVIYNGILMDNPLAGGLNAPQPSRADLNNDGVEDLYVFDRAGNVHLTFINEGSNEQPDFRFNPAFGKSFPACTNFALLRDFNNDGIADLFAHLSIPIKGLLVYRGYYDAENHLAFEQLTFWQNNYNAVPAFQQGSGWSQLWIADGDVPAIDDVDGDGDMDVLSFDLSGVYVQFFENQSQQMGYGADSIILHMTDPCWGKFYESSFSQEVSLSDNPNVCADGLTDESSVEVRHAGSTLATFDVDADGDKELVLGDIINPFMVFLENGGTPDAAFMTYQDATFPSYDESVYIPVFPSAFFLDIDGDGLQDFVAASNQIGATLDKEVLWYYRNVGDSQQAVFSLQQKDWLVEGMLDVGSGSYPAFFDYNADGLQDILLGAGGVFDPDLGNPEPHLMLLENVGTQTEPAFEVVDEDYLAVAQYAQDPLLYWNFVPAFGDVDSDGDQDLVLGDRDGRLLFFENQAAPGQPVDFAQPVLKWMDIDVGQNSAPFFIDLNRDGLLDLLVGERNGNINYFENKGTPSSPLFETSPDEAVLGGITTQMLGDIQGNSCPWVLDFENDFALLSGSESGKILFYTDVSASPGAEFSLMYENFGQTTEGIRVRPALADIDADGYYEMAVGNLRGGLGLFETDLSTEGSVFALEENTKVQIEVFPNPVVSGLLHWEIRPSLHLPARLSLWDAYGRKLWQTQTYLPKGEIDLSDFPAGFYYVVWEAVEQKAVFRFVVQA